MVLSFLIPIVIKYHYRYAKRINEIFNEVLFIQFFGSVLQLCTNVYFLGEHITESESMAYIVYAICMFVQIYVYCWSGNEVMLKVRLFCVCVFHLY